MKVFRSTLMGIGVAALMFSACAGGQKAPQLTVSGLDPPSLTQLFKQSV